MVDPTETETLSSTETVRYEKLSVLDSKTGSLLQLSSVLLVVVSIDPLSSLIRIVPGLQLLLIGILLSSCILLVYVLWFAERPTSDLVARRIRILNVAAAMVGLVCLIALALTILVSLRR